MDRLCWWSGRFTVRCRSNIVPVFQDGEELDHYQVDCQSDATWSSSTPQCQSKTHTPQLLLMSNQQHQRCCCLCAHTWMLLVLKSNWLTHHGQLEEVDIERPYRFFLLAISSCVLSWVWLWRETQQQVSLSLGFLASSRHFCQTEMAYNLLVFFDVMCLVFGNQ